jgi:ferredoxin-type protein NapH
MRPPERPGAEAVRVKGRLVAHRWLLARRFAQGGFLAIFLLGPWLGWRLVDGTLASSRTLGVLSLTDPLVLLQSLAAGHLPAATALTGALIVIVAYLIAGGRTYCSWVCPINPVTDAAHWLSNRLDLPKGWQPRRGTRQALLLVVLAGSALTGTILWELVNPVTMAHRALVFGTSGAFLIVLAVFLFDLLVSRRGFCGHLCPVGAFYGHVNRLALVKVSAARRADCDDCMDCYAVCPEPHVLTPALKGAARGASPVILEPDCTSCGRCIDVCSKHVYRFTHRFDRREAPAAGPRAPLPAQEETVS